MSDLNHSGYPRLKVMADLLAAGHEPVELDDLEVLHSALVWYVRDRTEQFVRTEGHEGRPQSALVARSLMDDLHSGLYQVLRDLLSPPARRDELS